MLNDKNCIGKFGGQTTLFNTDACNDCKYKSECIQIEQQKQKMKNLNI